MTKERSKGTRPKARRAKVEPAPAQLAHPPFSIEAIVAELAKLRAMTCSELVELYQQRFGVATTTHNAKHLRRKLAAKFQLDAIPPKERERLELLEPKALEQLKRRVERRRQSVNKVSATSGAGTDAKPTPPDIVRDPRLPPVGTVLTKKHKADMHQVKVLADGFEWQGEKYASLSKIAFLISGTRWNGFLFFELAERKRTPSKEASHA